MRRLFLMVALATMLAACSGVAPDEPEPTIAPEPTPGIEVDQGEGTGAGCELLTADDFAAAGIDGAGVPTDNPDGFGGHYCVYAGTSGATGGIEFDVFPHDDPESAAETYHTIVEEGFKGTTPTDSTFTESEFVINGEVAYLAVREGSLVFALSVPNDVNTLVGLMDLAELVVARAEAAAG